VLSHGSVTGDDVQSIAIVTSSFVSQSLWGASCAHIVETLCKFLKGDPEKGCSLCVPTFLFSKRLPSLHKSWTEHVPLRGNYYEILLTLILLITITTAIKLFIRSKSDAS